MHLRKDRTHHTGSSNLANRPEGVRPMTTQPGQTRISFLSTAKVKHVDEVIEARLHRTATTPFEKTRSFYGEHSKPENARTKIGAPRTFLLEDPEKMKMPFTGDTFLIYDKNLQKYRDYNSPLLLNKEPKDKELLAKEKHEVHAQAIQETQLVGYDKYNLDTLKNNVNLEKVREAKRVIRRKYANRKNMQKIFAAWDIDKTGSVSLNNLYSMAKVLGLNLNYDEARVLLASADRKGNGALGLGEFFDLVHNKDDGLNVNLENLSKYIGKDYLLQRDNLENEDDNIIKKLGDNARKAREIKHMNQVNVILKNKLGDIIHSFGQSDPYKKGYTTFDYFEQNLLKLGIDEKLISRQDIKSLYDKYKLADHTMNYRTFIEGLKSFNFLQEDVYKEYENPKPRVTPTPDYMAAVAKKEDGIPVVDIRTLPYSTVYTYLGKKRKVSRLVQKFFPRKDDLKNYLAQALNIPKEEAESHVMTKDETKNVIVDLFKKFDVSNLTQRDFEGFLSTLIYNKHNCTKTDELLKSIYEEDEDALIQKINIRKKGPPPNKDMNENLGNVLVESNAYSMNNDANYMTQDQKQKKVNQLLDIVDDRLFTGKKKFYDLYKMFDVDKDGYISRKDFVSKAEEMHLVPKEDIPMLVDYLDSDNKGYVNFQEFHKKIRKNATQQDENANPTVFPSVLPSKIQFEKVANYGTDTRKKLDEIASTYKPENYTTARPTSRFGQAPAWKNTFLNIQAPITSPMFISERERFIKTPEAKVLPTFEEKEKKFRIQSAKMDTIRHHQELVQQRAAQDMLRHDSLDQSRLRTKFLAVSAHEQGAKLRNNFML